MYSRWTVMIHSKTLKANSLLQLYIISHGTCMNLAVTRLEEVQLHFSTNTWPLWLAAVARLCAKIGLCLGFLSQQNATWVLKNFNTRFEDLVRKELPMLIRKSILLKQHLQHYLDEHQLELDQFVSHMPYFTRTRAVYVQACNVSSALSLSLSS
jgi:hypothetical protein